MSNHPFQSRTPEFAYFGDNYDPKVPKQPLNRQRTQCLMCQMPMSRAWFRIGVDGPAATETENKFARDDFCSLRCLRRALNGLPDDDARAVDILIRRAEEAEREAKRAEALNAAHDAHLHALRAAFAVVTEIAPGLAKGVVPLPGAALVRHFATLKSLVGREVYVSALRARR